MGCSTGIHTQVANPFLGSSLKAEQGIAATFQYLVAMANCSESG